MMRQINLFNPALLPKKHHFSSRTMLQAMLLIIVGTGLVLWYGNLRMGQLQKLVDTNTKHLANLQTQLDKVNAEFAPKQKDPTLANEIKKAEQQWQNLQELQTWLQATTLGNAEGYAKPMAALARQSVDGLWLTGFDFGDAGQEISLRGRTVQAQLIPSYVQKLANEASFQGKAFAGLEIKQVEWKKNSTDATAGPAQKAPYVEFVLHGAQGLVRKLSDKNAATSAATSSAAKNEALR